jgi:hypothetical protein
MGTNKAATMGKRMMAVNQGKFVRFIGCFNIYLIVRIEKLS